MASWMYDEDGIAHFQVQVQADDDVVGGVGEKDQLQNEDTNQHEHEGRIDDDEGMPDWLGQLTAAAEPEEIVDTPPTSSPDYASDDDTDGTEDTERTDFLQSSPCARFSDPIAPAAPILSQPTMRRSNHFNVKQPKLPIQRPRPRVSSSRSSSTKSFTSANALALDKLGKLERSPSRTWTEDERVFLASLFKLYEFNMPVYAKLFNQYFSTKVPEAKIRSQLGNLRVFSRGFHSIWSKVDAQTELRLWISQSCYADQLKPRQSSPGMGFGRNASERTKSRLKAMLAPKKSSDLLSSRPIQQASPQTDDDTDDSSEVIVDIEDFPTPLEKSQIAPHPQHHNFPRIAFRCWDDESWTFYSKEEGFVGSFFASHCWTSGVAAGDLDSPTGSALDVLLLGHLNKKSGMLSPFVSVTTSFLQCLTYAASKKNASIAVINLSALESQNIIYIKEALSGLKRRSQAQWARYRGTAEYVVYGTIPSTAIIAVTSFDRLEKSSPLWFECIQPGRTCKQIAKAISNQNRNKLTPTMSMEIGTLSKEILGMNNTHDPEHLPEIVEQIVGKIVDAFKISGPASKDEMLCNRVCFSRTLRGNHPYGYMEVEDAFGKGVQRGLESIAFYSRGSNERTRSA
ncbi:hypothetical protein DM02DRAFT_633623 [Periconia macrospinosa]|uniref:DUF7587 domain-containing protein n=1 Tax=Periconia macrospinosa TaxID=97972 RepID=A0A2V1DAJ3_9PLEO|nr:hypothetical protein DM02DRAFT_633623 [Periconia macrospinosa]